MQTSSLALRDTRALQTLLAALGGSLVIALCAQIIIPLPFTPVPITSQTFAVALIALCLGRRRAGLAVLLYLAEGALGLPVFAGAASGLTFGPTLGYLLGMLLAANWVGFCADKNWARGLTRTFLICFSGSVLIFTCGLAVLSFFIPAKALLVAGFIPFALGDFIKNFTASALYVAGRRLLKA